MSPLAGAGLAADWLRARSAGSRIGDWLQRIRESLGWSDEVESAPFHR